MQTLYDYDAPKKATNLSINSDLLRKAKRLKINLSASLEQTLNSKLAKIEGEKWAKKNKRAIKTYNSFVEEYGCFSDDFREF